MRKLKLDKGGVLGLDIAKSFLIVILTLGVVAFASVVAITQLNSSTDLGTGSLATNQTTSILNNISGGVTSFFSNAGSWFALLAVVIIILIVSVVIVAVNRFGSRSV